MGCPTRIEPLGLLIDADGRRVNLRNWCLPDPSAPGASAPRASAAEIEAVATALNGRPRKTLGWRTPAEALDKHLRSIQQAGVATID